MLSYVKVILRGLSQVMLQNNALTGLLFVSGIFLNGWPMGLGAIIGTMASTYTAKIMSYSQPEIDGGIYGFNGALIGIAGCFFFQINLIVIVAIICGAVLSSMLMHEFKTKFPPYTLPFILVTWIMICVLHYLHIEPQISAGLPKGNLVHIWHAVDLGFSQVMFQENLLAGIFFFVAILVSSPLAAVYAFYGSLLGSLLETLIASTIPLINIGLFGYNAVLCGIALGGKTRHSFVLATLAILLSTVINFSFGKLGLVSLTFPFVVATWAALIAFGIFKKIRTKLSVEKSKF